MKAGSTEDSSHVRNPSSVSINEKLNPPPDQRFLNMKEDELTMKEVRELLSEYKRIARHLL